MSTPHTSAYDSAHYLQSEEDMAAYLDAALQEGDAALVARALGTIARARGVSELARQTGISREGLYKALSGQVNPSLDTILKVTQALGIQFQTVRNA